MNDDELEELARSASGDFTRRARELHDFRFDEQQEKYWDITTGNLLGPKAVDGAVPRRLWPTVEDKEGMPKALRPSVAINDVDTGLTVEGSTWWPGKDRFMRDIVVTERGARELAGAVCYNSYIAPVHSAPPEGVTPEAWLAHVGWLFPDEAEREHFFNFAAHAIQRPDEKVNHGVVIAGGQGIGKDTALVPLRRGVGEWNAAEVGPDAVTAAYNGFVRSVLLVINEVRPHEEDYKASNFYNLLKPLLASPPEMLPMTVKYANTVYVRNLSHVILTTNDPLTMYIPAEDRRLFVMSSVVEKEELDRDYFAELHAYLEAGGSDAVVEWLRVRNIESFSPTAPPPMTRGKELITGSATQVRRTLVDDILEFYSDRFFGGSLPDIIFHRDLTQFIAVAEYFDDAEKCIAALNAKNFHYKMAERGFDLVKNPHGNEWKRGRFRTRAAFVAKTVPRAEQIPMVESELMKRPLEMGAERG